ncbi:MAG: hypothetical protein KJZ64_00145 [Sphingomonadaceae bacterium]|nr:hypothetical protein [Sphingomonadaceae bacterium]
MEAENFLAPGFAIRHAIHSKSVGWRLLADVAKTWQPSRLKGIQVSQDAGTPFLAATQVFDFQPQPRKWLALARTDNHAQRFVQSGTILLTCSGSVGRATLADQSLANTLISHDLLRIEAINSAQRGWLYAYLRAPTVRAMMTSAQYGHMIKHLEVGHLDNLPFIEPPADAYEHFEALVLKIIGSRDEALGLTNRALALYGSAIGEPPELGNGTGGFTSQASAMFGGQRRLEGHFHNPVARSAEKAIENSGRPTQSLVELVEDVFIPGRFKHVYGPDGFPYLDSAQILEVAPDVEKFVLSLENEKKAGYLVESGTLLLPCSGQLHGIIGSVVLADHWHENKVLTNHILRIVPKVKRRIRIGYLQAVLAHPSLGRPRVLRGAYGSSVPELSVDDIKDMAIPRLTEAEEARIGDGMERAAKLFSEANELEEQISGEADSIVRSFLRTN